ncbi:MAG: hypothetical protein ASARMPRED_007353 [Alectoria sarmentosa]|nr:MAG: hypothetical protein ASARMPRED_007353 [Alectoria sarmentosa]
MPLVTLPSLIPLLIEASTNIPSQAEKVAKASVKAERSVTARFSVTTSRVSPSPPSVVSRVVEVSSVSQPVSLPSLLP